MTHTNGITFSEISLRFRRYSKFVVGKNLTITYLDTIL